jgi:hypothetical protein
MIGIGNDINGRKMKINFPSQSKVSPPEIYLSLDVEFLSPP